MGFISNKGKIALFGVEPSYGSIATSIDRILGDVESFTPPTRDKKVSTGHQLSSTSPSGTKQDVMDFTGGSMTVVFRRGDILEYIIGLASDAAAGDAYDHTITPDDIVSSLSIAMGEYDTTGTIVVREVFLGCVISSLKIDAKKGQKVKMTIGFECGDITDDSTAITADYFTDDTILFKGSTLTVSSTTVSTITDFTWSFTRKISTAKQLNSLLPVHKSADEWDANCTFSYYFVDLDELELFDEGSGGPQDSESTKYILNFTCTNGKAGANERTIVIRGSQTTLGKHSFGDDGGFVTGVITGTFEDLDIVCTDATANWDA